MQSKSLEYIKNKIKKEREEKMNETDKSKKQEPISILIKEPIRTNLINLNRQVEKIKNDMGLIVSAYLAGAGHCGDGKYQITKDFNFINFMKEEKKENGKKGN